MVERWRFSLYPTFPATIRLRKPLPDQGLEVLKRIERPDGLAGAPDLSQACRAQAARRVSGFLTLHCTICGLQRCRLRPLPGLSVRVRARQVQAGFGQAMSSAVKSSSERRLTSAPAASSACDPGLAGRGCVHQAGRAVVRLSGLAPAFSRMSSVSASSLKQGEPQRGVAVGVRGRAVHRRSPGSARPDRPVRGAARPHQRCRAVGKPAHRDHPPDSLRPAAKVGEHRRQRFCAGQRRTRLDTRPGAADFSRRRDR